MSPISKNSIPGVVIAIGAGLVVAFHMGKIPGALPHLTEYFGLSLLQSGLIVSSFSLLAAMLGMPLGVVSLRLGFLKAGFAGLLLVAAGATLGAISNTFTHLLISRIIEGLGFVLVVVTMPGLINHICPLQHRPVAMGVWGAFIPAAMTIMLVVSPWVMAQTQWQGLWWMVAILSLVWALGFLWRFSGIGLAQSVSTSPRIGIQSILHSGALWVIGVFVCYSALFAAVTAFLPTYWTAHHPITLQTASFMAAIAIAGNIVGNILAGYLVGQGYTLRQLIVLGLSCGGICAGLVFSGWLPLPVQLLGVIGFTFFSGMVPGAVFASVSVIVINPGYIPLLVGMIFQGAGLGQVLGPLGLSAIVDTLGSWKWVSGFILSLTAVGIFFGLKFRISPNR